MVEFTKTPKGDLQMRIIIDTDKELIIVPDTFYKTIDKKNDVLKQAGITYKKIEYIDYVKDCFAKAVEKPWARKSDVTNSHRR